MLQFKDWDDQALKSIVAPTFLVIGDHDVVTPRHAVKMSHIIPNSRLMVLPGVHGSFIGEVCTAVKGSKIPELAVEIIGEFFWIDRDKNTIRLLNKLHLRIPSVINASERQTFIISQSGSDGCINYNVIKIVVTFTISSVCIFKSY